MSPQKFGWAPEHGPVREGYYEGEYRCPRHGGYPEPHYGYYDYPPPQSRPTEIIEEQRGDSMADALANAARFQQLSEQINPFSATNLTRGYRLFDPVTMLSWGLGIVVFVIGGFIVLDSRDHRRRRARRHRRHR